MTYKNSWQRARDAQRGTRANRFEKLEDLERRCNGDSRCTTTAMVEFDLQMVNAAGEPIGQRDVKRVCTRHRVKYEGGQQWKIYRTTELPPLGPPPRQK